MRRLCQTADVPPACVTFDRPAAPQGRRGVAVGEEPPGEAHAATQGCGGLRPDAQRRGQRPHRQASHQQRPARPRPRRGQRVLSLRPGRYGESAAKSLIQTHAAVSEHSGNISPIAVGHEGHGGLICSLMWEKKEIKFQQCFPCIALRRNKVHL